MGINKRGIRNGTGPYKDSYQRQTSGIGRRKAQGEKYPKSKRGK